MNDSNALHTQLRLPGLFLSPKIFGIVSLILLLGIAGWSVYPIKKRFHSTSRIEQLRWMENQVIPYEAVVTDSLPKRINLQAKALGCRGTISVSETITGVNYPDHLFQDVHLGLRKYPEWKVLVDQSTYDNLVKRIDELMKKRPGSFTSDERKRFAEVYGENLPDYLVKISWQHGNSDEVRDVKLTLTIVKTKDAEVSTTESFKLTHPETEASIRKSIAAEVDYAETLNRRAKIGGSVALTLLGIGLLVSALQLITIRRRHWVIEQHKKYLLDNISNRWNYLRKGNFVAALELAENYLHYFPHDIEIAAFKKSVNDFTQNNPHQMQLDLLELEKIKHQIASSSEAHRQLISHSTSPDEEQHSSAIEDDLPAILARQGVVLDEMRLIKEVNEKGDHIQSLLNQGRLTAARKELELLGGHKNTETLNNQLRALLETRQHEAVSAFHEIENLLRTGAMVDCQRALTAFLAKFPEYDSALELQTAFDQAQKLAGTTFRLVAQSDAVDIFIFCHTPIITGRDEPGAHVDIGFSDRRISRNHAELSIVQDQVILRDLGSTNGTFLNGAVLHKESVPHKSTITLSKVLNLDISIHSNEGQVTGLHLASASTDYLIIHPNLPFGIKNNRAVVPGPYVLRYTNKVLLLITPDDQLIFEHGKTVKLGDLEYRMEAIS